MTTHTFDPSILREYDIRGLVGKTLTAEDCYFVGRAFGTLVRRRGGSRVSVGFDGRESSPAFAKRAAEGLRDCGLHVEFIGLGPTPMAYFAMKSRKADAAVMVTGSHGPPTYNGVKMAYYDAPVYGDMVQEVGRLAQKGDFEEGSGRIEEIDVQDAYVDRLLQDYKGTKGLSVAWDNGNGAAGEILRRLVKKLPGKHVLLYDKIDGTFPNHHPDPTVAKNLVDLQKAVKDNGCDLGIGFDGDGDRIGAVDEKGNIIWADLLMAVYAADVLKTHPGATIIADVKSSRVLFDEVNRLGGKGLIWSTGHSLIKQKMLETNSPLGGELSGHICFADKYYGFDDAPYCAVRLLDIVSRSGLSLSALTAHLPSTHNTPEVRFHVPAARKFDVVKEIKARLKAANLNNTAISDIDGVRVTTPDGWWLLRASNTEEMLSLRAEGFTEDGLGRLKAHLSDELSKSGVATPL